MNQFKQMAVLLIACTAFAGCASQRPVDACLEPKISKGLVGFLNAKVGKLGGPPETVVSIEDLSSLDGKGFFSSYGGGIDGFICHGTLQLIGGQQESGTVTAIDSGPDQQFDVTWESDSKRKQKLESELQAELIISRCNIIGSAYEIVANVRNANRSPEDALSLIQGMPGTSLGEKKTIINKVYFDPAFENAWGDALSNQMATICMKKDAPAPVNIFKPIKY
jgi:hypothetical protein